jgi:putative cardiolipin synthase
MAPSTSIDLYREPAEVQSCLELASNFFEHGESKRADITPVSRVKVVGDDINLTSVLLKHKTLREKYTKVTESIRDFEVHADIPIKGKTKLVLDPREGYLAKIMMIKNAKKTIDLSYYIFKNDDTGKAILHELRVAIKRGVKVRILVDSSGSISKAPFYDDIKALVALSGRPILDEFGNETGELAKAEAVLFNPVFNIRAHVANWLRKTQNLFLSEGEKLPEITFTINRRSHDKILLVDAQSTEDSIAMIGGRNIADHYYAVGEGEEHIVNDAEVMIKGFSSVTEDGKIQNALEDHFNKIYFYLANKNFENFLFKTNRETVRKEFKKMRNSARDLYLNADGVLTAELKVMEDEKFLESDFEDGLISILNEIQNLSRTKIFLAPNGAQNRKNGNSFVAKLHADIAKAKESVDIVSPYFWVPDEELDFMIEWAKKDPKRRIRVFSNSITTSDNIIAQSMVDATFRDSILKKIKGTEVENQFQLFSYGRLDDEALGGKSRYGFLHAKIVYIDKKKMSVSTSNLDPISRHLNSEVGTSIEELPENSKNIAKMQDYIDELEKNSTQWGTAEWKEIRNHPNNRILSTIQLFVTKIIYALNLVPLI